MEYTKHLIEVNSLSEECVFLRKMCKKGCDNYQCRAFFPEKQPMVQLRDVEALCKTVEHRDCPRYIEGHLYQEEKRSKRWKLHCPYASNTVCSKPWLWLCKARGTYFELTIPERDEKNLPVRDSEGNIVFKRGVDDIKDTCLSGNPEIYKECPNYKMGEAYKAEYLKKHITQK